MKKLIIKELIIRNFKGLEFANFKFNDGRNNLSGENGTFKTTLTDAFSFLLTGNDSYGRSKFDIKNKVNTELNTADHEVTGIFDADGTEVKLSRVYAETWTKKRGAEKAELTGNSTNYFYNEVPCTASEFKSKLNMLIGDEKIFNLISNPMFFNNDKLFDWKERRSILSQMAGNVTNDEVFDKITTIENKGRMNDLINVINAGETLDNYKKLLAAKRKKVMEEVEKIPVQIKEVNRIKPDVENWLEIESQIHTAESEINDIERNMLDRSTAIDQANKSIIAKTQEKFELNQKLQSLVNQLHHDNREKKIEAENNVTLLQNQISTLEKEINFTNGTIASTQNEIIQLEERNAKLRIDAGAIQKEQPPINSYIPATFVTNLTESNCPKCGHDLNNTAEKIQELKTSFETQEAERKQKMDESFVQKTNNFLEDQKNRFEAIKKVGIANNEAIEIKRNEIISCQEKNSVKQKQIDDLKVKHVTAKEYLRKINEEPIAPDTDEISQLKIKINMFAIPEPSQVDNEEFNEQKQALKLQIDELKKRLNKKEQVQNIEARVEELKQSEITLSQEQANYERMEFAIAEFNKEQANMIEQRTNKFFKYVTFRMFEKQLNEGQKETCECMVDGVPYASVNTAGRINAGLDIINALTEFYGVSVPIFLDNKESVNKPIDTISQIICLSVGSEKELTIL